MHGQIEAPRDGPVRKKWARVGAASIVLVAAIAVVGFYVMTRPTPHSGGHEARAVAVASAAPVPSGTPSQTQSPKRHRRHPPAGHALTPPSTSPLPPSSIAVGSNCLPAPADTMTNTVSHTCGFPDTTNTGAPNGTPIINVPAQESSGPGWTYSDANGLVVTGNGTVINHLNIVNNGIEIKASNVTIENSAISETGDWWGIGLYHSNNVTIEHCDISSPYATGANRLQVGIKDVYGDTTGSRILDNNIWHTPTAIQVANGVFEGNYIHDYGYSDAGGDDDHLNGISVGGGDLNSLLIQDNTILDNYGQTDAIALFQDFGNEANKTITSNLLAGGSYTVYGGGPNTSGGGCGSYTNSSGCYGPSNNIVVTNNRFSAMYFPTSGTFGPIEAFNQSGSGNVWSRNYWIDGPNAGKSVQ
jgi:hypothetical protein